MRNYYEIYKEKKQSSKYRGRLVSFCELYEKETKYFTISQLNYLGVSNKTYLFVGICLAYLVILFYLKFQAEKSLIALINLAQGLSPFLLCFHFPDQAEIKSDNM